METIANSLNLKLKTLKSLSTTRWACRAEAVSAIKENYTALLVAIKEISDRTKQADVRAKALGILNQMKTFEFIFAMLMLNPILSLVLKVSVYLQSSNINLLTAFELVKSLKQSLILLRNNEKEFQDIFKKTVQMCNDNDILIPDLKRRRVSSNLMNLIKLNIQ